MIKTITTNEAIEMYEDIKSKGKLDYDVKGKTLSIETYQLNGFETSVIFNENKEILKIETYKNGMEVYRVIK